MKTIVSLYKKDDPLPADTFTSSHTDVHSHKSFHKEGKASSNPATVMQVACTINNYNNISKIMGPIMIATLIITKSNNIYTVCQVIQINGNSALNCSKV